MKQALVHRIRTSVPPAGVRLIEEAYRRARVQLVSAKYGYPARGLRVIAVTGTNGKTTTVSYINEILKEAGKKTAMFSTAQIEIDGQLELNRLNATVASTERMQQFFQSARRKKVDFVLLEMTSHALDQHKLDTVPVEVAIMTNLTQDHLDYHGTMEAYASAKARLFKGRPPFIVLNRDDEWFSYYDKFQASAQKITYGTHLDSEALISDITLYKKGSEARLTIDHQTKLELATALPGTFNVSNMAAAAAACYVLGITTTDIIEGVANLEAIPGRFERVSDHLKPKPDFDIIVDYAHTPDALEKLLEATKATTKGRITLVFGACGDRDKTKRPLMGEIAARLAHRVIVTEEESYNENPAEIRMQIIAGIKNTGGERKLTEIPERYEAIRRALTEAHRGDTVLITGMGHETFRVVQGRREPWNDSEVVQEIVEKQQKIR